MSKYTLYIHTVSGDIATLSDWQSDYRSMDKETWHGKPLEECQPENWLTDGKLSAIEMEVDDATTERTSRLFDGSYNNAREGEQFCDEWSSVGYHEGARYIITWRFSQIKGELLDDDGSLPWDEDHIYSVHPA